MDVRGFGWSLLGLLLLCTSASAQEVIPLEVKVGPVSVKVLLGDILDQEIEGLVVSHRPDLVNDSLGIGEQIVRKGSARAFEAFEKILEEGGGELPYASVHPTVVEPAGVIRAKYLLNVIDLQPQNWSPLNFDTIAMSVRNALAEAEKMGLDSLGYSVTGSGLLDFGLVGQLSLSDYMSAVFSGVKLYGWPPKSNRRAVEFRVVLAEPDTYANRSALISSTGHILKGGRFLVLAVDALPSAPPHTEWRAMADDFVRRDLPTLRIGKPSFWARIKSAVCDAFLAGSR